MTPNRAATARLSPFGNPVPGLELVGRVTRAERRLELLFRLEGAIEAVKLGRPPLAPARRDRLWEATCFEAFFSEPGQPFYWELNVAPSLDWNLYHFRGYREGMRPESRVSAIAACEGERGALGDEYELSVSVDLSKLVPEESLLDVSLAAVIVRRNAAGEDDRSYWAVRHAGEKPDFHLRRSFELRV